MSAYLSAVAICAVSVLLGAAICCRSGRWSWTAPSVGLSATMLLALLALRLPGHAGTAAVVLAVIVAASALSLRRPGVDWRALASGLPVAALVLGAYSLPFLANGHIGELGAAVLDDLMFHMGQADALRSIGPEASVTGADYPNGPHAAVAVLGAATAIDTATVFSGLLLAVPVLTALTALAAFERVPLRLRALGAALTGVSYLLASYLAEGAFKEPIVALCFLGFVLTLRDAAREGRRLSHVLALLLTTAGGVAAFGVTALAWPIGALVWLGIIDVARRGRPRLGLARTRLIPALAGGAFVATAGIALAAQSDEFFRSGAGEYLVEKGAGGNFVGHLSPFEALGIWPSEDFRFVPSENALLLPGVAVAIAAVSYGLLWCRRRREWVLLAAALGALTVYLVARPFTLAYFSGKALAVLAPILMLITMRALAAAEPRRRRSSLGERAVWTAAVTVFVLLAAHSSGLALRGANVRPRDRGPDVAAFRPITDGEPTLYLGRDNYVGWELRGTRLSGFQNYDSSLAWHVDARPQKADVAVDVDSLKTPKGLDFVRYLVAPRTAYASVPPPNFRPIRRSRWHVLWRREAPTDTRSILLEGEAPGAVLDCRKQSLRRLAQRAGVAYVRPRPVVGDRIAWRRPGGARPGDPGTMLSGESLHQALELGRGTWDISFRYFSAAPLRIHAGRFSRPLPAYVGDPASFFSVGRVTTRGGSLPVSVEAAPRRRLGVNRTVLLGDLAATRVDDRGRILPLRRACGAYVDWYRLGR